MKNSKQSHDSVQQNASIVKQSHKHDANLQKNSTLYFQVGLIVCLLAALGLLEMQFETTIPQLSQNTFDPDDTFVMEAPNFKVYAEPKAEIVPKTKQKKLLFINNIDIKKDTDPVIETLVDTPDSFIPDEPFNSDSVDVPTIEDDLKPVPFALIENVPVYPGCEKKVGNEARKKCMSDKITRLVQKKFNGSDIASNYGLVGRQKIYVEFLIDKSGKVSDVQTRAPHLKLEEEAKRVVNKIPKMQPGMQRDKAVGVRYTLPLVFKAQ